MPRNTFFVIGRFLDINSYRKQLCWGTSFQKCFKCFIYYEVDFSLFSLAFYFSFCNLFLFFVGNNSEICDKVRIFVWRYVSVKRYEYLLQQAYYDDDDTCMCIWSTVPTQLYFPFVDSSVFIRYLQNG